MTREQAILQTQQIARENNWPCREPLHARRRRGFLWIRTRWVVVSNAEMRGCNVRIVFDDATGTVLEKAFLPR